MFHKYVRVDGLGRSISDPLMILSRGCVFRWEIFIIVVILGGNVVLVMSLLLRLG